MSKNTVLYAMDAGIARVTLNRPDRLNSFNKEMHSALRGVLQQIESDPDARVIVLTGAGRGFCAGQDLGDRNVSPEAEKPDLGKTIGDEYNPLIKHIHNLDIPIVCAVNGVAAGAGANIALACDIVIAADTAKFVQVFANIGLMPDSGGTYYLPRHIGQARTLGLSLLAEPLMADTAKDWGLIWEVCPADELEEKSMTIAKALRAKPKIGLALNRKAVRTSFNNTLDEQLELERKSQQSAGFSDDYAEGVRAFMEKRKPNFTGH